MNLIYKKPIKKIAIALMLFFVSFQTIKAMKIVSLAPSLTKNIYDLKANDDLKGCTSYCYDAKKDAVPIVASVVKVNVEKVVSLKPDIVVATGITPNETIIMLRKLGIKTEVFETPASFLEVCLQFQKLGRLIGKENLANAIIEREKNEIERLKQKVRTLKNKPKVFFQIGANPLFAVIPNTYMNYFLVFEGCSNIIQTTHTGSVSRESVVMRNPDYIFVVTMGMSSEHVKEWMVYKEINAVKNKRVLLLDADMACTPTPVSFTDTFEKIVSFIDRTQN